MFACNGFADMWSTVSGQCVDERTGTALRCDGKFDQGGSFGVGTWVKTATGFTLLYPSLGGGTMAIDCEM